MRRASAAFELAKQRVGTAAQPAADFQNGRRIARQGLRRRDRPDDVADGVERVVVGKVLHPRNDAFRAEQGLLTGNLPAQYGGIVRRRQGRNFIAGQTARIMCALPFENFVRIEYRQRLVDAIEPFAVRAGPHADPIARSEHRQNP